MANGTDGRTQSEEDRNCHRKPQTKTKVEEDEANEALPLPMSIDVYNFVESRRAASSRGH